MLSEEMKKMNTEEQNLPPVLDQITTGVGQDIRETTSYLNETRARTSEGLEESLDNIKMKFNDVRNSVVDKTKEYARTTNSYIRKNPWAVIGISAGFAFLVGMLIGRRRDD
jgi:ElaB/YqjD/DUF883 family membrane-anchored ribosome-binding protein